MAKEIYLNEEDFMDLIFKGDIAVAINPIHVFIKSVEEGCNTYYHIRASFNDGSTWVRLTKNYDSYDSVTEALKTIYQEAIDLAFKYKETQEVGPIKVEVISNEVRDLEEEE